MLTDLKPEEALVSWYGMRTWIEGGFKDFKRGLWGWHHSKMQRGQQCRAALVGDGGGPVVVRKHGMSGGGGVQQEELMKHNEPGASLPERHIAVQTTQANGRSTSRSPLELRGARKTEC